MTAFPEIQSYIGADAAGYGIGNTAAGLYGSRLLVWKAASGVSGNIIVYDVKSGAELQYANNNTLFGSGTTWSVSATATTITASGLIVINVSHFANGRPVFATLDASDLSFVTDWNVTGTQAPPGMIYPAFLLPMTDTDGVDYVFAPEFTGVALGVFQAYGADFRFAGHRFLTDEAHASSRNGRDANTVYTVARNNFPTAVAVGFYKTVVAAGARDYPPAAWPGLPNAYISTAKLGTMAPAAVDATWTHFLGFNLLGCASDGDLIVSAETGDAVANQHYLLKLDAATLAIVWKVATAATVGTGVDSTGNTLVYIVASVIHNISLIDGSDVIQNMGQSSAGWSQNNQWYDYASNSIYTFGEYTHTADPPYRVSGTDSWGASDNWYRIILGDVHRSSCCEEQVIVDEAVVALLANRDLRVAHLVEFDFRTTPRFLWNGNRDLKTLDGRKWSGLKKLGGISGLEDQGGITSAQLQFVISGIDAAVMALAISEDRSEYVNQIVTVWLQFFDANWQCVGNPIARTAGIMEGIKVSQSRDKDGQSTRTIMLTAENIFYGRGSPPDSYYTDRDQQLRSPGDRGLGFVPETQNTVIPVPW